MTAHSDKDTWPEPLVKARAMLREGRPAEALKLLREALSEAPGQPRALLMAARASMMLGRYDEAERWLDRATESGVSTGGHWMEIGVAYAELRRISKCAACFQTAVGLEPDSPRPLVLLARARLDQGLPEAALSALERARALAPDDPEAATVMAVLLEKSGRLSEAATVLAPHVESPAAGPEILLLWSRICRGLDREVDLVGRLRALLGQAVADRQKASILFELAARREWSGDYEGAFEDAGTANELAGSAFEPDAFERLVESIVAVGAGEFDETSAGPRPGYFDPVFVVGVPRSGTTLVEQILSMHPRVLAVGEHTRLEQAARNWSAATGVPFPLCLNHGAPGLTERLRDDYLAPLSAIPDTTRWVTDKMPTNFLRLGLAARLFPGARVVRCVRDPLDTGVSCFFQEFGGPDTAFANDWDHIGRFIRAEARIMAAWCASPPLPVLEMRYEALVSDPVEGIRSLLSFLDLEWADECLRFDESRRYVTSPSSSQVRRPMYVGSIGRHRRYLSRLGPLRRVLEEPAET